MHHQTIEELCSMLYALAHDPVSNKTFKMLREQAEQTRERLLKEMEDNVMIVWTPDDLSEGYDLEGLTPCEALQQCRKDLEDASHGWDIIADHFRQVDEDGEED